jgi:hypothetical protein
MAHDTAGTQHRSSNRELRQWAVILALVGSLVGVPVALLTEFRFGLLASLGLSGNIGLGLFAMIPGFALGGLALVVMLGT